MRGKLIAVYCLVVVVVGLLSFTLVRAALGDILQNADRARDSAAHAAWAANNALQLQGLNMQRWLSEQATDAALRDPFKGETPESRSEYATVRANKLFSTAGVELAQHAPTIVAFVDENGVALGRNGSNLLRGDALGKFYPALQATIKAGTSGSDLWVNRERNEQMVVSYASVRDANGKVLGAILLGTPLDDGLLTSISKNTSGTPILVATPVAEGAEIIAKSSDTSPAVVSAFSQGGLKSALAGALGVTKPQPLLGLPDDYVASSVGLSGFGDNKRGAIIAVAATSLVSSLSGVLLGPIAGATLLGIILAAVASMLLGAYITKPIVELEEGLLAVINGQTDKRFELEHAEFGGLVFRINTLLNTLMGVPEDDTDDQGRPSYAPDPQNFREALSIDERPATESVDRAAVTSLRSEPATAYYDRLFAEYIQAKRSLGQRVEHITRDAFVTKIQLSEADASAKQGKPVRFKVELRGSEVNLIAIPLELAGLFSSVRC